MNNGWYTDGSAGIFRAIDTRDAAALRRDGQRFVDSRPLRSTSGHEMQFEVLFEDGIWMLAGLRDLDLD
ncbi:MAG: hypothetical protein CMH83_03010 [Nocardioides sp.]|nr:hypothetical protein [Nocardioides sp.]